MSDDAVKIRAIVQGYQGDMMCVFAIMDESSGFLLVTEVQKFNPDMDFTNDLTILTNVNLLPTWTMFFKEEQLREAIEAYHSLAGNELLELESNVQRYDPVTVIQFNGMKESGTDYRFNENISNGHVGVLLCALFAQKQLKIRASLAAQMKVIHESDNRPYTNQREQDFIIEPITIGYFF